MARIRVQVLESTRAPLPGTARTRSNGTGTADAAAADAATTDACAIHAAAARAGDAHGAAAPAATGRPEAHSVVVAVDTNDGSACCTRPAQCDEQNSDVGSHGNHSSLSIALLRRRRDATNATNA